MTSSQFGQPSFLKSEGVRTMEQRRHARRFLLFACGGMGADIDHVFNMISVVIIVNLIICSKIMINGFELGSRVKGPLLPLPIY